MAKYLIYHVTNPNFHADKDPVDFPKGFEKVAEVETEGGLEKVFELTNHIDHDWTTNPEVIWRKGTGADTRSTSVGDVVVDEKGCHYICDMVGWREFKKA